MEKHQKYIEKLINEFDRTENGKEMQTICHDIIQGTNSINLLL